MRYIKSFEKYTAIVGTGYKADLPGQVVTDDEEAIYPSDVEITGHIGTPVKSVRVRKLGKSPKVGLKKASPNYPEMRKRNNQNQETTLLNSLPSQS
jgi:hypothetical protein